MHTTQPQTPTSKLYETYTEKTMQFVLFCFVYILLKNFIPIIKLKELIAKYINEKKPETILSK